MKTKEVHLFIAEIEARQQKLIEKCRKAFNEAKASIGNRRLTWLGVIENNLDNLDVTLEDTGISPAELKQIKESGLNELIYEELTVARKKERGGRIRATKEALETLGKSTISEPEKF